MQETTAIQCASCATVAETTQRCPFCNQSFCDNCFTGHMNWERRNEQALYAPGPEVGGTPAPTSPTSTGAALSGAQKRRVASKVFWKMNCDLCGRISLDLRECPVCKKKICRDDYEAHMDLEEKRTQPP